MQIARRARAPSSRASIHPLYNASMSGRIDTKTVCRQSIYVRENRQMRPSNPLPAVWDAEAIDTSHLGFWPIQKIATIHASSGLIRGISNKVIVWRSGGIKMASAMKLYNHAMAPNPRRVRIFAAEKGIELALQDLD